MTVDGYMIYRWEPLPKNIPEHRIEKGVVVGDDVYYVHRADCQACGYGLDPYSDATYKRGAGP